MRIIIHSKTLGAFLDFTFGGAFFSFVPTIFAKAKTFAAEATAREYVEHFGPEEFPDDLAFLPVDTDAEFATMEECVAAGVAPWEVREVAPFKVQPGALEQRLMCIPARSGMSGYAAFLMMQYAMKPGVRTIIFDKGISSFDDAPFASKSKRALAGLVAAKNDKARMAPFYRRLGKDKY